MEGIRPSASAPRLRVDASLSSAPGSAPTTPRGATGARRSPRRQLLVPKRRVSTSNLSDALRGVDAPRPTTACVFDESLEAMPFNPEVVRAANEARAARRAARRRSQILVERAYYGEGSDDERAQAPRTPTLMRFLFTSPASDAKPPSEGRRSPSPAGPFTRFSTMLRGDSARSFGATSPSQERRRRSSSPPMRCADEEETTALAEASRRGRRPDRRSAPAGRPSQSPEARGRAPRGRLSLAQTPTRGSRGNEVEERRIPACAQRGSPELVPSVHSSDDACETGSQPLVIPQDGSRSPRSASDSPRPQGGRFHRRRQRSQSLPETSLSPAIRHAIGAEALDGFWPDVVPQALAPELMAAYSESMRQPHLRDEAPPDTIAPHRPKLQLEKALPPRTERHDDGDNDTVVGSVAELIMGDAMADTPDGASVGAASSALSAYEDYQTGLQITVSLKTLSLGSAGSPTCLTSPEAFPMEPRTSFEDGTPRAQPRPSIDPILMSRLTASHVASPRRSDILRRQRRSWRESIGNASSVAASVRGSVKGSRPGSRTGSRNGSVDFSRGSFDAMTSPRADGDRAAAVRRASRRPTNETDERRWSAYRTSSEFGSDALRTSCDYDDWRTSAADSQDESRDTIWSGMSLDAPAPIARSSTGGLRAPTSALGKEPLRRAYSSRETTGAIDELEEGDEEASTPRSKESRSSFGFGFAFGRRGSDAEDLGRRGFFEGRRSTQRKPLVTTESDFVPLYNEEEDDEEAACFDVDNPHIQQLHRHSEVFQEDLRASMRLSRSGSFSSPRIQLQLAELGVSNRSIPEEDEGSDSASERSGRVNSMLESVGLRRRKADISANMQSESDATRPQRRLSLKQACSEEDGLRASVSSCTSFEASGSYGSGGSFGDGEVMHRELAAHDEGVEA